MIDYLEQVDPAAAERARERYACFEHFGGESQAYGRAVSLGIERVLPSARWSPSWSSCSAARVGYLRRDGLAAEDEQFYAEQNARLVAERRAVLPVDVRGARLLLEPARPPHGRTRSTA